jgi:type I restriction enzyme S subunit
MLVPKNKKEQSILAQVLSDIDFLIQSFDRLIEKKKNIKQGTMQELLKGTNRLQGSWETKEGKKWTPLGQIPEDWDVKKLGEIAYITKLAGYEYSKYFNSYKDSGDIIVIRGTNITNNKLDLSDVRTIPKSTSEKLPRSKLFANDLVFAYVGTIGPVFLIEDNDRYHLGPNTCKIVAEKTVVPKFLFCYFTSWLINKEIAEQISIGAQPSLSMSKIRNFDLIVPGSIDEQNAIAEVLTDMTKEIEALECQRDKYRQVKSGMMQQLLTGRIRLTCKN